MNELTITLNSLSLAFQSVKENHGCAGTDGVTIEQFEGNLDINLKIMHNEITEQTYFPLPLLKILVDKGNGEARALCIPTVRDRVVQTAVLQLIEPILEREFEECSFGYRKGRSVKQAVYKIKEYYEQGYHWVVDADIDAFFDSVDHALLLEKFKKYVSDPYIQKLIELWLKAEIWDGKSLIVPQKGIPQGSPISPILANLFLDELDEAFLKKGYKIVRYADDFIILCKKPDEAMNARQLSKQTLEKLHLQLDEEQITSFEQGFKFLGVVFVRSMIMVPFDRPKKERKILFYPDPLNINDYLMNKRRVCNHG
ncbi:MAG TPA: group II intron reverse transcriptase/maturase [Candidatus Wunengus sp. YC63]|uniref:group II intron reverse transcriptase/maturase n=1 Tax=Candidatus Wunengus sp. YC63 TaxID=3367699 RepID=UPI004026768D